MRVQIISDVHTEFHRDDGAEFVRSLDKTDVDVLVVAGDTATKGNLKVVLEHLCRVYPEVVWVAGNHDYYQTDKEHLWKRVREVQQVHSNFHPLENDTVTINGQRFVGCTLWFPDRPRSVMYRHELGDFHYIKKFTDWVFTTNAESQAFLRRTVTKDDIVVTHHIPSWQGTLPYWWNKPLSDFFVCEMDSLIEEVQYKVHIYGHTHDRHNFKIGATRLVCNPFGYLGRGENVGFDWHFVLEV
jgi:predicted phosphodiesterase